MNDNIEMREKIDLLYSTIKNANDEIDLLRKKCPHTKTKPGKYMWRVGSIVDVNMCVYCDEIISNINADSTTTNNIDIVD